MADASTLLLEQFTVIDAAHMMSQTDAHDEKVVSAVYTNWSGIHEENPYVRRLYTCSDEQFSVRFQSNFPFSLFP